MYATCLFCNSGLGANEIIEHFPVGRQLAFDAATGRLWVVCRTCERWNLSPFDSRWEAIEDSERAFRSTRVRVAGENISLARMRDGTELVRIGRPIGRELSVWRYGDQFGRRRRSMMWKTGGSAVGTVALSAAVTSGIWAGPMAVDILAFSGAGSVVSLLHSIGSSVRLWVESNKVRATVNADDGSPLLFNAAGIREISFVTGGRDFDWKLRVPRFRVERTGRVARLLGVEQRAIDINRAIYLHGDGAARALATVLPLVNLDGGDKRRVNDAISIVQDTATIQQLLRRASLTKPRGRSDDHLDDGLSPLGKLPAPLRLALEMSLHEDDERRAMQGELRELEQRWRDADTIAQIADSLLLPVNVGERLQTLRDRAPMRGE